MAKFITIEGGEGVGKSLFVRLLESRLKDLGLMVHVTREPGGTGIGQQIRAIFMSPPGNEELDPIAELFLVSAARCQHVKRQIVPALHQGSWVLCDRFHDSTRVYQGRGGVIDSDMMESVIGLSTGGVEPHLTFILDCDVTLALSRIEEREAGSETGNRYDRASQNFHQLVRDGYLQLRDRYPDRIVLLDAAQEPQTVVDEALKHLHNRFGIQV